MARKHNTKHYRTASNYPNRLRKRGLTRTPVMPSLGELRKRQGAYDPKVIETRYPDA